MVGVESGSTDSDSEENNQHGLNSRSDADSLLFTDTNDDQTVLDAVSHSMHEKLGIGPRHDSHSLPLFVDIFLCEDGTFTLHHNLVCD
jgi:hypothetical protein